MFGRIALIVAIAFAVVAGLMAFNTLNYTSLQATVDPVETVPLDEAGAADRLAKAITYRTISHMDPAEFDPGPFQALIKYLRETYPRVHETLTLETVSEYSLLYTWPGTDDSLKPIVLCGHTDVVPVAPGTASRWQRGAFDYTIEEGYIWGRGSLDDKVNVLGLLEAVEKLLGEGVEPERSVILAFGHDEEIGGPNGAVKMAELLDERGIEAEYVLDEGGAIVTGAMSGIEGPVATIGIAEKGYVSVRLRVEAEGGHSSQPPQDSAIGILSRAVHRVETNPLPASIVGASKEMLDHVGPEMPLSFRIALANLWLTEDLVVKMLEAAPATNAMLRTTTAPTIFHAGVKDNVLPAEAEAVINFRILPGETVETVVAHVTEVVDDERVNVTPIESGRNPSNVSSTDAASFETLSHTIKQIFPDTLTTPYLVVAGTDARHYEIISENVYRFTPLQLQSEDLPRIHGVNERIRVDNYADVIRFYRQLILNTAV